MRRRAVQRLLVVGMLCLLMLAARSAAQAQVGPGTTVRITDHDSKQRNPSISGNIVVWEDHRSGQAEVYGYDLTTDTEFPIATGGHAKAYPEIDGSLVMWKEKISTSNYQVLCKDLQTGGVYTVEDGANYVDEYYSAVGRSVFYSAQRGTYEKQHIHRYDLDTGQRTRISPDTDSWHRYPQGKDGYLVWSADGDLGILNTQTGSVTTVSSGDLGGVFVEEVATAQGKACFLSSYTSGTGNVYDIAGESLTSFALTGSSGHPSVDGNMMIVTGNYPADSFSCKDLATGQIFDVVIGDPGDILHTQRSSDIDDMRVVWTRVWDDNFEEMDIYLTELVPEPGTLLLLGSGLVGLVGLVRHRR